jgi:predicted kinase
LKKLILTVGLPRSGKSTWARQQGHPIVSRDAIRLALHGQSYIQERENEVTIIENLMVKALFLAGHDTVIIDACHASRKRRIRWVEALDSGELGPGPFDVECMVFPVGPEECKRRAEADGWPDLAMVIDRMYEETDVEAIRLADEPMRDER